MTRVVNLRSDTVTRPTDAMRRVVAVNRMGLLLDAQVGPLPRPAEATALPALTIIVGGLVGFIALSLIMPMYQLISNINDAAGGAGRGAPP